MSRRSRKRREKEQAEQEALLAEDAFVQQGSTWVTVLEKHIVLVIAAIVTVLVTVVIVESLRATSNKVSSEQTVALMEGVQAYEGAIRFAVVTSTSPEEHKKTYETARDTLAAARTVDMPAIRSIGLLYDADLARRGGLLDEAVDTYDQYLAITPESDPLRFYALEGKGYALEALGRLDDALSAFRLLAEITEFDDFGNKHVARVLLEQGDALGAKSALTNIVNRRQLSLFRDFAEKQLGELD
ncbi:MAG: hypothetical protein KTR25_05580 [Myxococcales bacterium]|nr:hypothetical protein [Myxococcales bacterium]